MNPEDVIEQFFKKRPHLIFGFSDLTGLLAEKFGQFTHAIVIAEKLSDKIINGIEKGPTLEYYQHYKNINDDLLNIMLDLSEVLIEHDVRHRIIAPTVADDEMDREYFNTLEYSFSHKMAATRAGLGWIGKTDLFVSRQHGPRIRLATILTDRVLSQKNLPVEASECGECRLCVEACPAQAANGVSWNISTHRNVFFDPFKCLEKCREQSESNFGKRVSVCGICVSVCPVGKKHFKHK
jgi:epoxyqueuosine reductase